MRKAVIRNRKPAGNRKTRVLFALRKDLLNEIKEVADANDVSVSAFLRESARRNIAAYRKAQAL